MGLDHGLMTQFTSFVAVEGRVVTKDGKPQRVEVPVEMPEGVSYEGGIRERQRRAGFLSKLWSYDVFATERGHKNMSLCRTFGWQRVRGWGSSPSHGLLCLYQGRLPRLLQTPSPRSRIQSRG